MYPCKNCGNNQWEVDSSNEEYMKATCLFCDNIIKWKKKESSSFEKKAWAIENNYNLKDFND